jgi:hypothetical protein
MRVLQFAGSSVLVLFGSLTCALVDASAETDPHLRHRNLQECPQVSVLAVFCPPPYLDGGVVCKGNCEYGNLCLAATAGILESFCEKPNSDLEACPENVLFPCSGSFDKPVICSSGCQYDNICLAIGAGGRGCEVVSEEVCPIPGLQPCPLNIDPVKCGPNDCTYGNLCVADAAGFTAYECKSLTDLPEPEPGTCPVTGPAVSCINEPDPVICGPDGCEYGNLCLAVGAGFKQGVCVSHCPIGNRGIVVCDPVLDPVLCAGLCVYDNLCSAQAGPGFTEADCESISSECPESDPGLLCITLFQPVDCSGCIYSNECFAAGAGYAADDCVLVVEEPIPVNPNETPECTESDPDRVCIALFQPVDCNGCIYNNGCFAGGAGYEAEDCVLL